MKKKILTVVAHPDDEVLGVGGTLALHSHNGDEVYVLILADGEGSRGDARQNEVAGRKVAAQNAAKALGVKEVFFADFADNQMDTVAILEVIKVIEAHFKKIKPDVVYTHHHGDLNVDHRIVFEAVLTASRPIKGGVYPKQIYCFETVSSTEWSPRRDFTPSVYKNIESVFEKKIKALECYDGEMRDFPHPRSYEVIRALAQLRGSEVALNCAESFECIRDIQD